MFRVTAMTLAVEPQNRAALQARLSAHELLLEQSGETFSEIMWLKSEIAKTRETLLSITSHAL
ncbi:hypothetical protein N9R27_01315 [Flavobacteriaceae bacterium]|nr:hypothetical protein [Flavobacteriaceae bacterium]